MTTSFDVAVIGGGVMGLSTAFHLLEREPGLKVAVVERDPTYARASTPRSAGGVRLQFSLPENVAMSAYGLAFYKSFGETMAVAGERPEIGLKQWGYLFLLPEGAREAAHAMNAMQAAGGARNELLDPDALARRFPSLNLDGIALGSFGPEDGWTDPHAILMGFRRKVQAMGASLITDEVLGIGCDASGARSLALPLVGVALLVAVPGQLAYASQAHPAFRAIADAVDIPIIVYNIPPRSVVDMSVDTMARLARDCPNIVGVKDATNDLTRPLSTRAAIGENFAMLSGEDATVLSYMVNGGDGCISVTANVAPRLCALMHEAWQRGDTKEAMKINARLFPLHQALFVEPNPVPAKFALSLLERMTMDVRLPLTAANAATQERMRAAMTAVGLIN